MSWFWNASDKTMCPVKLGFISSCCKQVKCIYGVFWQIHHLWLAMGDTQMKRMRGYTNIFKKKAAVLLCPDSQLEGWISLLFTGWYNLAVLKMSIPTFIELEVQLDTKMKRHCCFFFLQRKLAFQKCFRQRKFLWFQSRSISRRWSQFRKS